MLFVLGKELKSGKAARKDRRRAKSYRRPTVKTLPKRTFRYSRTVSYAKERTVSEIANKLKGATYNNFKRMIPWKKKKQLY